ncbi:hypothetical protein PLICRDRAFT_45429 [Plicaturopsis crispa FD-325 SS-3]|uniref:Galactose mutarotase-like protein n=1 Tax=Plicaturopsis crispa FD-325 SS-3 TaxID=944288 RepID=A0A0C9T7F9_PLICR|nr:hypothetical protein PLICRDRAFT_45429 [Plicaturopsis crispa FD-325 SS-3]
MAEFNPVLITLPSLTPSLALEILPRGLTIHRIIVQADGRTHDLVVGPETPSDHLLKKYTNTIVGRYANRVPVGTYELERHGRHSQFTPKANESEGVSLHGGPEGFDARAWRRITASSAQLFSTAELAHLSEIEESSALFTLTSPDGDQGFPGILRVEVLYALVGGTDAAGPEGDWTLGTVVILYRAKLEDTDDGSVVGQKTGVGSVTPINLTQHWGFNLDASLGGDDSLSVKDHTLNAKATYTLPLTPTAVPTGDINPTKGDPKHTHAGGKIGSGEVPEGGYDHFYILSTPSSPPDYFATRLPLEPTPGPDGSVLSITPGTDVLGAILREVRNGGKKTGDNVLELASEKSGLALQFNTNQSGVQFYSNNFANGDSSRPRKKIHGGGVGKPGYDAFSAAFLEFHEPLSAFLYPKFQQRGDDTLLASGEVYNNWVTMTVKYHKPT